MKGPQGMQEGSSKKSRRRLAGRSSRVLSWERLGALAGWAVILLFIGTAFVESTGVLSRMVRRRAQAALTPLGLQAQLGDSRIGWLSRSLNLSDVRIMGDATSEELEVSLRDVRLVLGFGLSTGFFLERIETKGGHVHFSEEGLKLLRQDLASQETDSSPSKPGLHIQPHVLVEGLMVQYFDGRKKWDQGSLWVENKPSDEGLSLLARWLLPTLALDDEEGVQMGAPQQIVARARLVEGAPLRVQIQAHHVDLATTNLAPLLAHWVPAWQRNPIQGVLSLEAKVGIPLAAGNKTSAELRLSLRDAYTPLTAPGPNQQSLQNLDLDFEGTYVGRRSQDWRLRQAWSGRAQALTRWNEVDLRLQSRLGRDAGPDSVADFWLQTDSLEVSEAFSRSLNHPKVVTNLRGMLDPEGTVALAVGLRLPADLGWLEEKVPHLPVAVQVQSESTMSVAYVGPPNPKSAGQRNVGFPRRIEEAVGKVVFIAVPGLEFSQRTAIHGVQGRVGDGRAQVSGGVWAPLVDPGTRELYRTSQQELPLIASSRLSIRGQNLTFDDPMLQAFEGMTGVEGAQEVLADFSPRDGAVELALDYWGQRGRYNLKSKLDVRAKTLAASWRPFPIPMKDVTASVVLTSDDNRVNQSSALVRFEAAGTSPVARSPLRIAGHSTFHKGLSEHSWTQLSAPELNLRSSALKSAIDAVDPELRSIFEQAHLTGWLDVVLQSVQVSAQSKIQTFAEARPHGEGLSALPGAFPIETNSMQGRILARSEAEPGKKELEPEDIRLWTRTHILGRFGSRTQPFPLSILMLSEPDQQATGSLAVADIDVLSPLIVGAIGQYLASDRDRYQAFDPASIPMQGRISGSCELLFAPPGSESAPEVDVRLELDLARFGPQGKELLRDLKGQVSWSKETGSWTGKNLTGLLGETHIDLHSLSVHPDATGTDVVLDFSASNLPIDELHLEPFLEPELLHTLISELGAKGTFDVDAGHLTLFVPDNGPPALRLQGQVHLRNAFIRMGLPVEVEDTRSFGLDLHYEGSRVRARGTIEGLVGQVAERRLEDANFQFTYVAPRLTIEEFTGSFEGGRLESLGAEADGPAGFFALDLEPPFRFSLSTAMDRVDVGLLLAGVFNSDFANEGLLDGELRLNGDVDHLTEVRGSGHARLSDTALWAIPVFQSLFSQLGFDTTATFKLMQAGFHIGDGRIDLHSMQIKSDLLSLIGSGWVDFEGELSQDLEVRYSLVDRLGPFTKLLYLIQNSLLRISIRGDMARPRVVLNGLFSQFMRGSKGKRQLPLPGLSDLPGNF
ncbi:MAG: AsmA-like C-terminal region-containing protein [Planctomycetota bacterium]|nr:AsmA-like C-terminal region-containing protein [Planctomycetota bacterium]